MISNKAIKTNEVNVDKKLEKIDEIKTNNAVIDVRNCPKIVNEQDAVEIETLTNNFLPDFNQSNLDKALNVVQKVADKGQTEKERVLGVMKFKVYRGDYKGYKNGTILVEITFKKCTNNEKLIKSYKEIVNEPKVFLDNLSDYVILSNISLDSIIECIEEAYRESMTQYKGDVLGIKADALNYYKDIITYVENNSEKFIDLKKCRFDDNIHNGYYMNEDLLVLKKDFLNGKIFVKEDISNEIVPISSNKKGQVLEILKQQGLLVCRYSSRKDTDVYFTFDKSDEQQYAYIFKIDKSFLADEVA